MRSMRDFDAGRELIQHGLGVVTHKTRSQTRRVTDKRNCLLHWGTLAASLLTFESAQSTFWPALFQ